MQFKRIWMNAGRQLVSCTVAVASYIEKAAILPISMLGNWRLTYFDEADTQIPMSLQQRSELNDISELPTLQSRIYSYGIFSIYSFPSSNTRLIYEMGRSSRLACRNDDQDIRFESKPCHIGHFVLGKWARYQFAGVPAYHAVHLSRVDELVPASTGD
jgi:hypothetical protein